MTAAPPPSAVGYATLANPRAPRHEPMRSTRAWTAALVLAVLGTAAGLWGALVSKIIPPLFNPDTTLGTWQANIYHVFLVPLLLPVFGMFVIVNWYGLKTFKHNPPRTLAPHAHPPALGT